MGARCALTLDLNTTFIYYYNSIHKLSHININILFNFFALWTSWSSRLNCIFAFSQLHNAKAFFAFSHFWGVNFTLVRKYFDLFFKLFSNLLNINLKKIKPRSNNYLMGGDLGNDKILHEKRFLTKNYLGLRKNWLIWI
jgi:hypothetical protein